MKSSVTSSRSIRVLLEACLRKLDGFVVNDSHVIDLANWNAKAPKQVEVHREEIYERIRRERRDVNGNAAHASR